MMNSDKKGSERLPEFQKYLKDKKRIAENKTTYFAYWVSRYLAYAQKQKLPWMSIRTLQENGVGNMFSPLQRNQSTR